MTPFLLIAIIYFSALAWGIRALIQACQTPRVPTELELQLERFRDGMRAMNIALGTRMLPTVQQATRAFADLNRVIEAHTPSAKDFQ